MTTVKTILFLGTTGYIGGSVLDALLDHPNAGKFDITTYFRSEEKAKKREKHLGLKTISGSFDVVREAAAKVDLVINCASSDDLALTEAVLAGAKKHFASTKVPTLLLHTSGTGVALDKAVGTYSAGPPLDDTDSATINALPSDKWHRNVDIPILKANREGYITSYTVYPGIIFGPATGRFVKIGLQRPTPTGELIIALDVLKRGAPGVIGPMKNTWNFVEIRDTANLYMLIFDAIVTGKKIASGVDGHYVAENGSLEVGPYFRAIGQALYELKAIKSAEETQFTPEELKGELGSIYVQFAHNTRTSSTRSRSLGWQPKVPARAVLDQIKGNMKTLVEGMNA
ncbi:hypothetical protein EIP91_012115 [Steccherinum ochraceum]|uniref:NAD(P)-binding domain-containing protein n=1 Tax=Steccherinum ochraceum TaxID=92696 RepID=A0A4V2MXR6_9APHY|nr:hypothetical protein EIP91_012115 [Steccherinum ochraceum]